jgi:hypothetical protein
MKHFSTAFALISLMAVLFLVTGCSSMKYGHANTVRLKIVDAYDGQPLSGTTAVWREDQDGLLLGPSYLGPCDLPPADGNGIITIQAMHGRMTGRIIFNHPGYPALYGVYSGGGLAISTEIQPPPFPQDLFVLDDAKTVNRETDGSFTVRMPK